MWAQLVNAALGFWLMAAPAVLGYGGAMAVSDRIVGPIAATFGIVAVVEVTRGVRWALVPLGAWVVVAPWLLGGPATAIVNGLIVGPAMVALARFGAVSRDQFGGGWAVLIRGTGPSGRQ